LNSGWGRKGKERIFDGGGVQEIQKVLQGEKGRKGSAVRKKKSKGGSYEKEGPTKRERRSSPTSTESPRSFEGKFF